MKMTNVFIYSTSSFSGIKCNFPNYQMGPISHWMFSSNSFAADDVKDLHFGGFLTKKRTDDNQVIVLFSAYLYFSYYCEDNFSPSLNLIFFFDHNAECGILRFITT